MGGITLEDFSQSVAYREIFGRGLEDGLQRGRQEGLQRGLEDGLQRGRQQGEQELALRQLRRRCGGLSAAQEAAVRSLSVERLEQLAEALLDFHNVSDLDAWLRGAGG